MAYHESGDHQRSRLSLDKLAQQESLFAQTRLAEAKHFIDKVSPIESALLAIRRLAVENNALGGEARTAGMDLLYSPFVDWPDRERWAQLICEQYYLGSWAVASNQTSCADINAELIRRNW